MSHQQAYSPRRIKPQAQELLCTIIRNELRSPHLDKMKQITTPICPHCGEKKVIKRGRDSTNKQRYQCKACNRSFTLLTGRFLSSTNISIEKWLLFAECYLQKQSLRKSADHCNVSLKTAFFMRKRLNQTIAHYSSQVKKLLADTRIDSRKR